MRDYTLIGRFAHRIAGFAGAIRQAHDMTVVAGDVAEPWSLEFHRRAVRASGVTMTHGYLADLGRRFGHVADVMSVKPHDVDIEADWQVVRLYLSNYAEACLELLPPAAAVTRADVEATRARTPPVMRFDLLAGIVSRAGAIRLEAAGTVVADWTAGRGVPARLSDEQVEWLQALVDGVSVIDLAESVGLSRRTMHRELGALWVELGVDTREAGLVRAAELGLVST